MATETEKKKKFYRRRRNPIGAYNEFVKILENKYFNLFRAGYKWDGLDYRQEDYIMRKFWQLGTVFAFNIRPLGALGFAPWTLQTWDMYHLPETVVLINETASPLIPAIPQIVDKDGCIGYLQRNKQPLYKFVNWYCERIAQAEMVINTNLQLHKMPFLIPSDENSDKLDDIIDRIINNELVVYAEGIDPSIFKAVSTSAPYLIDKLREYEESLENELKTYLGIDNSGMQAKKVYQQMDEVNAGNDEINDNARQFLDCLQEWCENVNKTLGHDIWVTATSSPVVAIGENQGNSAAKGPQEGGKEDELLESAEI